MSDPDATLPDLSTFFLGPKGENADVLERLVLEALRDHVFWRRNFHPEDAPLLEEPERHRPANARAQALLSGRLMSLLARLKDGVPFFSPRYVGHMCSDLTLAGVVGYLAALLYNPNNVSHEASPATTALELEVASQLTKMIGYPAQQSFGHLCSGGTLANVEALFVARNLKYLPVGLRWACASLGVSAPEVPFAGGRARLDQLELWELLNLSARAALDAADALLAQAGSSPRVLSAISRHSLSGMGFQAFGHRLAREFPDALAPACVLVPATAHYSWEKACRALGLGEAQRLHVPVDARFRMDVGALEETLERCARRREPVLACVAVIGSTEESAVDRLDRIADLRNRLEGHGLSFWLHADAAWGGYAAAATWRADGTRGSPPGLALSSPPGSAAPGGWPTPEVFAALCALERTDSVTLDPHKLGYVPYPAGAICFADRRVRALVASEAPYVFASGAAESLGRFVFEGSKPGAAAASVWLSHSVLPLDETGYGRLIAETARGARALHRRLSEADFSPFRVVLLPEPDLNIVCFAFAHPRLRGLAEANGVIARLHERFSATSEHPARTRDYFVTRTVLRPREYGPAAMPLLSALGFDAGDYEREGVAVLRCTVMNPFLGDPDGRVDYLGGFIQALRAELPGCLAR